MKKTIIVAILIAGGVAFASSLSVPWFVDNGAVNAGFPPTAGGVQGIVYLHNNQPGAITCAIEYFTSDGISLGPDGPDNTFTIAASSTIAFRPVADDPNTTLTPGGQENPDTGNLVPDRPMVGIDVIPSGTGLKKNGALVVRWVGASTDVQGILVESTNVDNSASGRLLQYGTLLPPGA